MLVRYCGASEVVVSISGSSEVLDSISGSPKNCQQIFVSETPNEDFVKQNK